MADAAEVANNETPEKPAVRRGRKPGASKATAASKPAAGKTATRGTAAHKAKPAISLKKASETAKEVAYVQLGLCGKVYDEVNERMSKARKQAPKQWSDLVKRGERVQRDLEKAQKDLTKDLRKRVNDIEIPAPIESQVNKFTKAVKKLTARVKKAA